MSLFSLLDRSQRAGRHLEWKVRVFTLGAALAVAGIYFEERWMTGAAIVVLVGGVLLRYIPSGRVEDEEA